MSCKACSKTRRNETKPHHEDRFKLIHLGLPVPLQATHFGNPFPSHLVHFEPLRTPVPLQPEQGTLSVPEPRQLPHSEATSGPAGAVNTPDTTTPALANETTTITTSDIQFRRDMSIVVKPFEKDLRTGILF